MLCNQTAVRWEHIDRGVGECAPHEMAIGPHRAVLADPSVIDTYALIRRLARSSMPILIHGETGSGKELAAAAVHEFSTRVGRPFISINCAAIPEALAESELFGHERGAFSGALFAKPGQLELAHGGTVFLDELGELPLAIQAKLLRAIETHEVHRLGDVKPRPIDIRIVAATHRDLACEIAAGTFRQDLFFRIGAARVSIPALRDCPRGLALLPARLLADACMRLGRAPLTLSVAATELVLRHRWPGNVRELKHAMDYAAAAAPDSAAEIDVSSLPPSVGERARCEWPEPDQHCSIAISDPAVSRCRGTRDFAPFRPIEDEVRELERTRMIEALEAADGIQSKAAELIGMPLRTFVTKIKRYAITSARKVS